MLQILFWMLFLAAVYVNASFKALFKALHLFSGAPLYGHVVAILILTSCYEIMDIIFIKINFQNFYKILYYKNWSHIKAVSNYIVLPNN